MKNVGGGENGISTKVLRDVFYVVGNRIIDIINTSLAKGVFPENWKHSTIIPVPKVANTNRHTEFRPINTVPVYEKLLELVVKQQLQDYCDKNNILVSRQSGFRENHSCETVIVNICDDFLKAVDTNNFVVAVFLDFKRAFETIDRSLLLKKLEKFGIGGTVLSWFGSYLHNRKQKVKFKGTVSDFTDTKYGVPQGTVLGPLLFLIYINDMAAVVDDCKIGVCGDDSMV